MKNRFNTLIILTILLNSLCTKDWTVDSLYPIVSDNLKTGIIDPSNYLSEKAVDHITEMMEEIKDFKAILIILDNIDQSYYNSYARKIDIIKFSEELIFKVYPDKTDRDDTLLIIYSIKDRLYRFRTGVNVRKLVTDSRTERLANASKPYLKSEEYDKAFNIIFDTMFTPDDYTGLYIILTIIAGVIIFIFIINLCHQRKLRKAKELKRRFQTLDELKRSGKDINLFIQENCVICLEELKNDDRPSKSSVREVFLECGHNFHDKCIKDWLKKQNKCPLCRTHIEGDTRRRDGAYVDYVLYDIQRNQYNNWFTYHEMNRIGTSRTGNIWEEYRSEFGYKNTSSGGGGGGGFSFDCDAGGTSGGW